MDGCEGKGRWMRGERMGKNEARRRRKSGRKERGKKEAETGTDERREAAGKMKGKKKDTQRHRTQKGGSWTDGILIGGAKGVCSALSLE